jgi:hypothetical protein
MKAYCYAGEDGRCAALARDDRALLPDEFGPWRKLGEMEIQPDDPDRLGMPTAICLENLTTHGTHFFQLKMTFE